MFTPKEVDNIYLLTVANPLLYCLVKVMRFENPSYTYGEPVRVNLLILRESFN